MSATAAGGEESPPLGFRSMRTLARGPGSCSGPVYRREGTFRRMYAGRLRAGAGRREPAARARFLREARRLGALRHPNVVAVLDGGEDDEGPFLRTDYAFGVSPGELSARLARRGIRCPPQPALRIGVADGHALWATPALEDQHGEPLDRKSTSLNSSYPSRNRMPSSARKKNIDIINFHDANYVL